MNQTILFSCGADFSKGSVQGLIPAPSIGRGALLLADGALEGCFVSPEIEVSPFTELVMSWNTDLPEGSVSEAKCRVRSGQTWSEWMSWGVWSPFACRTSIAGQGDDIARVSTDTLLMKDGVQGDAIQLSCTLRRERADLPAPALRLLAASFRLSLEDHMGNALPHKEIDLPAPRYSQMIRDPNIGSVMCSPTTATVMMNALGCDLLPEEAALSCWDHLYEGFGNWAFTVAAAASWGFETWLTYGDMDTIRQELAAGYSVGCNVAYSNTRERASENAPYMDNTPGFTAGHLLTVRGLTEADGREMVRVIDSYGRPDGFSDRIYPVEQFLQAWHGILYIIRPRLAGAGYAAPRRVPAKLEKARRGDEFRLTANGEEIALFPDFCGSKDHCTGIVACSMTDGREYATTANRPFFYSKVLAGGNLFVPASQLFRLSPLGQDAHMDVWVITDRGITYTASLFPQDL